MKRKLQHKKIDKKIKQVKNQITHREPEAEELRALSDLCERYEITVVSDEIWSDLILPGHRHIPTQSATPYLREKRKHSFRRSRKEETPHAQA